MHFHVILVKGTSDFSNLMNNTVGIPGAGAAAKCNHYFSPDLTEVWLICFRKILSYFANLNILV